MKEKNFKFKESFGACIKAMDDIQAGKFIKGVCDYAFERKPFKAYDKTLDIAFLFVKNMLDQEFVDRENGRIGGRITQQLKRNESPLTTFVSVTAEENPITDMLNIILNSAEEKQEKEENNEEKDVAE